MCWLVGVSHPGRFKGHTQRFIQRPQRYIPDYCLLSGKNVSLVTCSGLLSSTPCYIREMSSVIKGSLSAVCKQYQGAIIGTSQFTQKAPKNTLQYLVGRSPISIGCIEYLLGLFKDLSKRQVSGFGRRQFTRGSSQS